MMYDKSLASDLEEDVMVLRDVVKHIFRHIQIVSADPVDSSQYWMLKLLNEIYALLQSKSYLLVTVTGRHTTEIMEKQFRQHYTKILFSSPGNQSQLIMQDQIYRPTWVKDYSDGMAKGNGFWQHALAFWRLNTTKIEYQKGAREEFKDQIAGALSKPLQFWRLNLS
ncbi:hypothetical protein OWV82_009796 [Melia azedarach]|uniref:Uncharacterized protein n=1 Tax=Melia azedarach TaxID=155640 RepID=A0ACC1Y3I9_MELAZ|nr:hypothetical protein OWV82_009796 [Melia azedarach]